MRRAAWRWHRHRPEMPLSPRLDPRTFKKRRCQHGCKLLILRYGICPFKGSEYICLMNASDSFSFQQ